MLKSTNGSEVCHPRCVFKLYGEVNSVKNTTINITLHLPNRKDPLPATYKFIDAIDIPPNLA